MLIKRVTVALSLAAICLAMSSPTRASSLDQPQKKAPPKALAHKLKLVSLAPSNTEMLYTIGAGSYLQGVSTFCDYPPQAKALSKVGTFISANLERLSRIQPDYVLLVSGQEMLAGQLTHNHFKNLVLDNTHLADIGKNLRRLGLLTAKQERADQVAESFTKALGDLQIILQADQPDQTDQAKSNNATDKKAPTVFYCVWPQPLMAAGRDSFLNEVITACGGTNIAADVAAAYPRYSLETLMLKNPDLIIMPCEARGQSFLTRAPWTMLKAVKEKQIYFLADAQHDTLSRPTPRVLQGIYWLACLLHPNQQTQLDAWQKKNAGLIEDCLSKK